MPDCGMLVPRASLQRAKHWESGLCVWTEAEQWEHQMLAQALGDGWPRLAKVGLSLTVAASATTSPQTRVVASVIPVDRCPRGSAISDCQLSWEVLCRSTSRASDGLRDPTPFTEESLTWNTQYPEFVAGLSTSSTRVYVFDPTSGVHTIQPPLAARLASPAHFTG